MSVERSNISQGQDAAVRSTVCHGLLLPQGFMTVAILDLGRPRQEGRRAALGGTAVPGHTGSASSEIMARNININR